MQRFVDRLSGERGDAVAAANTKTAATCGGEGKRRTGEKRMVTTMQKSPTNHFIGHDPQNGCALEIRRTKAEIGNLCDAIFDIVEEHQPVTCRQAFYLCVAADLIDKAESEYKNTFADCWRKCGVRGGFLTTGLPIRPGGNGSRNLLVDGIGA